MQRVAAEMNVAETAFLWPEGTDGALRLRWFTPALEVDLCGHATLASAHVLWETGRLPGEAAARFATRSGVLACRRRADGAIEMVFPALPATATAPPAGLAVALGTTPLSVWTSRFDLLVELADAAAVRALAPDLDALARLGGRGVVVTAAAEPGSGHDFVSRFFAPAAGVPEDPVTGSSHCVLAPWWAARLGKDELSGWQASARGGRVGVQVAGERVTLTGRAVTVLRGEILAEGGG
jgi:PhzF family phenazine biosynthesis protein